MTHTNNTSKKSRNYTFIFSGLFFMLCLVYFLEWGPPDIFKKDPLSQPWALEQIQEDLKEFKEIKQSQVRALMQDIPQKEGFLHVKIKNGTASFSSDEYFPGSMKTRAKHVRNFFKRLSRTYRLPDVEFVLCLSDAYDVHPLPPIPLFVFAKKKDSTHNVLFPDFDALNPEKKLGRYQAASLQHPWESKQEVIFWRGSTTGGIYEMHNYMEFPRVKLVFLSKEHPEWLDAAFTVLGQGSPDVLQTILNLSKPLAPYVGVPDHFAYKYLIDIDGNSCTYERCRWILVSNSTLLKPFSHNMQWYYKALEPYVHYIPLKEDLSDLKDSYQWLKTHDREAQQIAENGTRLGQALFSKEGIQGYVALLLLAYSKLYHAEE